MKSYTKKELQEVLRLHKMWLNSEVGGIRADLSYANLSSANLSSANLSDSNLSYVNKIPMYCKWTHGITGGMVHIGCEKRTIEEWDKFFAGSDIIQTERNTEQFKQIQAVYEAYKAYINFLNN